MTSVAKAELVITTIIVPSRDPRDNKLATINVATLVVHALAEAYYVAKNSWTKTQLEKLSA